VTVDPWSTPEDGPPPPRRPAWGCLAAAIVTGIGLIVIVIVAAQLIGTALGGVHIR
jgi:hypothetical protein